MYAGAEAPCSSAIRAAKAVIQEVPEAAGSSIRNLAKCSECNPERDVQIMSRKCGLSLGVKITQVMIQGVSVAVLLLNSWLRFMLQHNMWHIFSGLDKPDPDRASAQWSIFWENYRAVCPSHPIYARAARGEVKLSHTCALLIHGDEGRSRKKNAIFVLSAHSILGRGCNTNPAEAAVYASQKLNFTLHTWATRRLMGVLPKGFYDQDDDQDSFFQDYLQVFVQDLLEIYDKGIYSVTGEKHDFVVLNTIGDWPFLAKAFSLSRCFANVSKHPTSRKPATGICHACLADRPGYPWEDFSENPAWKQTINQESPFNGSPALITLPHDRANPPSFIGQDCFHAWHLGAAKQCLASCLVLLVHTFAGSSIPKRFEAMSSHFLDWCKRRKVNPNIRKITRETVGWPSRADYPNAAWSKGSTSTAVLRWFLFACNDRSEFIEQGSLLHTAFLAAKEIYKFFAKSYREHVWIFRDKAFEISAHGHTFLRLHSKLARQAFDTNQALFLYMPNLHRLAHLFHSLSDDARRASWARNVLIWDCQIEEDFIGRPSRLSRRVGPQQVVLRTLERALQAANTKFIEYGFLIT